MVPVSALQDADSPRISGEDAEHVRRLAEVAQWPPITVHRPSMRVIDGMHRLNAARLRGQGEIEVRFFDGTAPEAFVLAVRLNTRHGLPLSLSDRKAAADRILASHPQWSDRLVASVTGLAAKTVAEIRRRAQDARPSATPDFGGALQRLKADASLRSTKTGRALLKLLEAHAMSEEHLAGVADIVPANCRNTIAQVALECAAAWWKFADRIDRPVSGGWRRWHEPGDQEPEDGGSS